MYTAILAIILLLSVIVKSDVIGHIQTLDYVICQAVKTPSPNGGEQLTADLLQLFIVLDEIHDMLRDEREKGKNIVQKLLDGGGLKLPSVKPDFNHIMGVFNWTVDESKVMGVTLKDTVNMWKDIEIGMSIVPTTEINYALNPDKHG